MSWAGLTLATDANLGALEPDATEASAPWGQNSWDTQLALAKRDLRVWVDADFPHLVGASDRIRDRWAAPQVLTETASAFTDQTVEASDDTEEDIDLEVVFATPGSDYVYVGALFEYSGLFFHMLDSVNANASVMTVSYWGKNGWTPVPSQQDGTIASAGKTLGQSGRVVWAIPTDWERRSLNNTGEEYYWTRVSVSLALTAGTAITQLLAVRAPTGLTSVHERLTLSHICRGLAKQAGDPDMWIESADRYMSEAKEIYERLKLNGGIPLDEDLSGAVDEAEQSLAVNVGWLRG